MTAVLLLLLAPAEAGPVLHLDFRRADPAVRLVGGPRRVDGPFGAALEFTGPLQYAEAPFARRLDGIREITLAGWVFPRRWGEQAFFFRGLPETAPGGEGMFPPRPGWVNFVLGTDGHGFLLATANGNGSMPFPHVTANAVPIDAWSHLAYVKDARGYQTFFLNGVEVHNDRAATAGGKAWPFRDTEDGEPVRLAAPLGGLVGEVFLYGRALAAAEVKGLFDAGRDRFKPVETVRPVALRDMDQRPVPGLWEERGGPLSRETWPEHRERILRGVRQVLGPMPEEKAPLEARVLGEEDCGSYVRRKVSLQVQAGERMPAYLLVPKERRGRVPAVVCFYGTTAGAGKDTTVGLSGARPGSPPERNRAFALDLVQAGFVALAADYLRDGERVTPGRRPYDTTGFYARFPDWSVHGKDAWDTMRAIDYLQSLPEVDPERIGMVGHSYGGHSTIFTMALEPRIKAAWANGPVSDFLHHGLHWSVPKGAGASQSLPALRPYVLDRTRRLPVTFWEFTALAAPRPLAVGQAVGERRPFEEENHAAVRAVYDALGAGERLRYVWYPGDHDFPPAARQAALDWLRRWLGEVPSAR